MNACLTVDVEQDCPPFLSTWRGIEEGLPRLLALLDAEGLTATCFVTGETARRFPGAVRSIVDRGHELGCHGDEHRRFDGLTPEEAARDIARASAVLRPFGPVTSFRAPHLRLPRAFLPLLGAHGFTVDSSVGRHKSVGARVERVHGVLRIPASVTSSTLRWPAPVRDMLLRRLTAPAVLFVHPWEFVDFRRASIRFDCRFRTGDEALACLQSAIGRLRAQGAHFTRLADLAHSLDACGS